MGLDQYLYANKNIGNAEWRGEVERKQFSQIITAMNADEMVANDEMACVNLAVKVGYWRKANQIHHWFVNNVQDGEDECREYPVSRQDLTELLTACVLAKETPDEADELLPPLEGFFFGSYEIDEYYWQDIDHTISLLSRLLETLDDEWTFTYRASW